MNVPFNHLSEDEIARYCGRKMSPAELLTADKHLAVCDACYARLHETQGGKSTLIAASQAFHMAADSETPHLTYEQLTALVDHQLNAIDREIVESHLEFCSPCATELNELREVVLQMDATPAQSFAAPGKASFRDRVLKLWRLPAFRTPALATAALVCVALFAFLISIPLRRDNAELRAKIAELEQSNEALKEQAATVERLQTDIATLREDNQRLLQTPPDLAQTQIALNDGGRRVTLDTAGNLAGLQVAPAYEQLVKETLRSGRVKILTTLTGSGGKAGVLMGDPANPAFRLIAPVNIVMETDRPTFRWKGLEGLATFRVTIFDEALNKVAESESLTNTQWPVTTPLQRGRTYIWQVRASANNREVVAPPPAASRVKFKVLEQAKIAEIDNAKRSYAKSHLIMGIIYADAGLLDNAEREFSALLKANPQSAVARQLLRSVKLKRQ
jgi:hypothetical protein